MERSRETEPDVFDPAGDERDGATGDARRSGDAERSEAGGAAADLDPLAAAERERDEATAQWQRAAADYQNLRRRARADAEAASKRARADVLADVLSILDYLDMALATECTTEEARNLKVGVSMTRDQLKSLLDRHHVTEIPASGEFDASLHQAISTVESGEHAPGTIVDVARRGWRIGDQVLRHAQVTVATPPRDAAGADELGADDDAGGHA